MNIYFNYGGDYLYRDYVLNGDHPGWLRHPLAQRCRAAMSSRTRATAAQPGGAPTGAGSSCAGNNKDVQEFTAGYWFNFYNGPKGRLRQGIQYSYIRRDLWSGTGGATAPTGLAIPTAARRHRQHDLHLVPLLPAVKRRRVSKVKAKGAGSLVRAARFLLEWPVGTMTKDRSSRWRRVTVF